MSQEELTYFHALKRAVGEAFQQQHPAVEQAIEEWKGQEIVDFQESLQQKVKGRISEKWFYTHIKNTQNERLPRIDMLNLLSEYVGFRNWQAFVYEQKQKQEKPLSEALPEATPEVLSHKRPLLSTKWVVPVGLALIAAAFLAFFPLNKGKGTYEICFTSTDLGQLEQKVKRVEVLWLKENESPITFSCDENGCIQLEGVKGTVKLVIQAPYFQKDTLIRNLPNGLGREEVRLKTDDYAWMIHLFSTSNVKDWKKRRKQLDAMFSEEAQIFQVYQGVGVEMLNKQEFIDKLTFPLESLSEIEVLETVYNKKNKIIALRFSQE